MDLGMETNNLRKFGAILNTGMAMFSMFFGAGNVVFPLSLGQYAQDQNFYCIIGLLITAVGVPFFGLIGMTLYDGNYKTFFSRMGTKTGFIIALVIMGLIGPFGAIPRCIALSFSTTKLFLPSIQIEYFSLAACALIFLFTIRKNSLLSVLGYVLTPLFLLSVAIIIGKGLYTAPGIAETDLTSFDTFLQGLKEGYQTMDLLGAFFFSSVVIVCLKSNLPKGESPNHRELMVHTLKASVVGASLLAATYIGFSYVAAFHSEVLSTISKDQLLGTIAVEILGPYAGLVACIAVALACLTTAIALAAVTADYLHRELSQTKIPYSIALLVTLGISFFISTLNFTGIVQLLAPILEVCYPALILLTICNVLYKLYNFQPVKAPVFALFALTLAWQLPQYFT